MIDEELLARFRKKEFGVVYFIGFSAIYLGGFGLLWYATNWKVVIAIFLICYGVLLQAHRTFVERD
jgi:uncharacterized membrane protein